MVLTVLNKVLTVLIGREAWCHTRTQPALQDSRDLMGVRGLHTSGVVIPTLHMATEPQSALPYPWCLVNWPSPAPTVGAQLGVGGARANHPGPVWLPSADPQGPTVSPGPLRLAAALRNRCASGAPSCS